MKILFWLLIAIDLAALFFWFLLGMAFAPSSHTSVFAVAGFILVVPGLILAGAIVLFVRSRSTAPRVVALLLAGAPLIGVLGLAAQSVIESKMYVGADGKVASFRSGPMREMELAISRNDAAAVSLLAPQVKVNARGYLDLTFLTLALRKLKETPGQLEVLRVLLKAGADPNAEASYELPLTAAILLTAKTGPEPVKLLLEAGANPNAKNGFGEPAYFLAAANAANLEVLRMLLDHGADVHALNRQGQTALFGAANTSNWKAVLLLLERGVDHRVGKSAMGLPFQSMVEGRGGLKDKEGGLAEVMEYLAKH